MNNYMNFLSEKIKKQELLLTIGTMFLSLVRLTQNTKVLKKK
jgi:hypothetical protein